MSQRTSEGTEVLGTFSDGKPAVTLANYGNGFGVYIATQAVGGALQEGAALLPAVIKTLTLRMGFNNRIDIEYPDQTWRGIDSHLLDTPDRTEILFISYLMQDKHVKFQLQEPERRVETIFQGIGEKSKIKFAQTEGQVSFDLDIKAEAVECIQIRWLNL